MEADGSHGGEHWCWWGGMPLVDAVVDSRWEAQVMCSIALSVPRSTGVLMQSPETKNLSL